MGMHAPVEPQPEPGRADLESLFSGRSSPSFAPAVDLSRAPWPAHNYVPHYQSDDAVRRSFLGEDETSLWDVDEVAAGRGLVTPVVPPSPPEAPPRPWLAERSRAAATPFLASPPAGAPAPAAPWGAAPPGATLAGTASTAAPRGEFAPARLRSGPGPEPSTFLAILSAGGRPVPLAAGTRGASASALARSGVREPLAFLLGESAGGGPVITLRFDWVASARKVGVAALWLASVVLLMLLFEALFLAT